LFFEGNDSFINTEGDYDMKLLIFITLAAISLNISARQLTPKEQLVLLPFNKTKAVKEYMQENIDESQLSFKDYFAYQLLKKSCSPLNFLLNDIESRDEQHPDQSEKIVAAYQVCSEGTLGMTNLYIKQQ
jgi:hypothetical protein